MKYKVIVAKDVAAAKKLQKAQYFDKYKHYNYTRRNCEDLIRLLDRSGSDELRVKIDDEWVAWDSLTEERKQAYVNDNRSKEQQYKEKLLREQGKQLRTSFLKQLECVGARIPTQAMQSFMPMEIIAYTDVAENQVYVNLSQTWLQGSDYKSISYIL